MKNIRQALYLKKMPEPPDDFMIVTPIKWRHDYWQGAHDGFYWLQSRQIRFWEFFEWVTPPNDGFRALITAFDGSGGGGPTYSNKPGWQAIDDCALSPPLNAWPDLLCSGNGDDAFILDAAITPGFLTEVLSDFCNPYRYQRLDDLSLATIAKFWQVVIQLRPLFYVGEFGEFSFISRSKERFDEFVGCRQFLGMEERLKLDAHQERIRLWNRYWDAIGPNCGPEICVENGCDKPRIRLAVRCFRHQLQLNNPTWFGAMSPD